MKYENFLLSEGRTKQITYDVVVKLIENDYSDAFKELQRNDRYIYRGVSTGGFDYAMGNGKGQRPRKSRNTENFMTLYFDNSPLWSKYPKRSESFICSNSYDRAKTYARGGDVYHVLPKNGTMIGVCPDMDIFISFDNEFTIDYMNKFINYMIYIYNQYTDDNLIYQDDDWGKLKLTFDIIKNKSKDDEDLRDELEFGTKDSMSEDDFEDYELEFNGDMIRTLDKLYNPKKNGFKLVKSGKQINRSSIDGNEVWMSGDCLFINDKNIKEFIN